MVGTSQIAFVQPHGFGLQTVEVQRAFLPLFQWRGLHGVFEESSPINFHWGEDGRKGPKTVSFEGCGNSPS